MTDYTLGKHPAKAKSALLGKAKTGTHQVGVEFVFTDGPNAGKHITWYGFFTDGTRDRTFESLRYAGWKGDDLTDLSSLSAEDVPTVQLVLEQEDHNGQTQVKVRWVNRLGGPAVGEVLGADDAKAFAESMRAHIIAADKLRAAGSSSGASSKSNSAKANGSKPAPSSDPRPTPPVEDVPF